jgi:hypothetical protein
MAEQKYVKYNGKLFYTVLEARWQAILDKLNVEYIHGQEQIDMKEYGYYTPDYYLEKFNCFIIIKEDWTMEDRIFLRLLNKFTDKTILVFIEFPDIEMLEHNDYNVSLEGEFIEKTSINYSGLTDINKLFFEGNDLRNFGVQVSCPICGENYVHISRIREKDGKDNYAAWEGRGDAYYIDMWCESGHSWNMRFGEHKGECFLKVVNPNKVDAIPALHKFSNNDFPKLKSAIIEVLSMIPEHQEL